MTVKFYFFNNGLMCFILLLLFRLWLCFKIHCHGSSKILSAPSLLLIGVHYLNAGKHRWGGKLHPQRLSSPTHYLPAENASRLQRSFNQINCYMSRFWFNNWGQSCRFLPWLEETCLLAAIDAATYTQTVEEIRHICSEFEKLSARAGRKARLAVKDLYSKWQGGEKKLQLVMRFLAAARLCMDEEFSKRNINERQQQCCSSCPAVRRRRWMLRWCTWPHERSCLGFDKGGTEAEEQQEEIQGPWQELRCCCCSAWVV